MTDNLADASLFWEAHRQKGPRPWTGRPNAILRRFTDALPLGSALDLECGEGNSALWLAQQGWHVAGVDVSPTALNCAVQHAAEAGVTERTTFVTLDLNHSLPGGQLDLVYALYLESPVTLVRNRIPRRAAEAVRPGALLLIVLHGSVAPWSWDQTAQFPAPQEVLEDLAPPAGPWHTDYLGPPARDLTGPNGQTALVHDLILALRNRP